MLDKKREQSVLTEKERERANGLQVGEALKQTEKKQMELKEKRGRGERKEKFRKRIKCMCDGNRD